MVEVRSSRGNKTPGLDAFRRRYPRAKIWLAGETGILLGDFFSRPAQEWFV